MVAAAPAHLLIIPAHVLRYAGVDYGAHIRLVHPDAERRCGDHHVPALLLPARQNSVPLRFPGLPGKNRDIAISKLPQPPLQKRGLPGFQHIHNHGFGKKAYGLQNRPGLFFPGFGGVEVKTRLLAQRVAAQLYIPARSAEKRQQALHHVVRERGRQEVGAQALAGLRPPFAQGHRKNLKIRPEKYAPVRDDVGLIHHDVAQVALFPGLLQKRGQLLIFENRLRGRKEEPGALLPQRVDQSFARIRRLRAPVAVNPLLQAEVLLCAVILVQGQRHRRHNDKG